MGPTTGHATPLNSIHRWKAGKKEFPVDSEARAVRGTLDNPTTSTLTHTHREFLEVFPNIAKMLGPHNMSRAFSIFKAVCTHELG